MRHLYEEFNVDSKAECDQLNLAHETKPNKPSAHGLGLTLRWPH